MNPLQDTAIFHLYNKNQKTGDLPSDDEIENVKNISKSKLCDMIAESIQKNLKKNLF